MTATKARKQLDKLLDTIRRSEVDRLAQQREKLAAYIDSHAADIEENPSIAPLIHALDTYLTEKHAALLPFIRKLTAFDRGQREQSRFPYVRRLEAFNGIDR